MAMQPNKNITRQNKNRKPRNRKESIDNSERNIVKCLDLIEDKHNCNDTGQIETTTIEQNQDETVSREPLIVAPISQEFFFPLNVTGDPILEHQKQPENQNRVSPVTRSPLSQPVSRPPHSAGQSGELREHTAETSSNDATEHQGFPQNRNSVSSISRSPSPHSVDQLVFRPTDSAAQLAELLYAPEISLNANTEHNVQPKAGNSVSLNPISTLQQLADQPVSRPVHNAGLSAKSRRPVVLTISSDGTDETGQRKEEKGKKMENKAEILQLEEQMMKMKDQMLRQRIENNMKMKVFEESEMTKLADALRKLTETMLLVKDPDIKSALKDYEKELRQLETNDSVRQAFIFDIDPDIKRALKESKKRVSKLLKQRLKDSSANEDVRSVLSRTTAMLNEALTLVREGMLTSTNIYPDIIRMFIHFPIFRTGSKH